MERVPGFIPMESTKAEILAATAIASMQMLRRKRRTARHDVCD